MKKKVIAIHDTDSDWVEDESGNPIGLLGIAVLPDYIDPEQATQIQTTPEQTAPGDAVQLARLGYSADDIVKLRTAGII